MLLADRYSQRYLAARAEIADRIHLWTRAVDRRDWALGATVFHPGAYDDHGIHKGDVEGLIRTLSKRYEAIAKSFHQIGNIVVEFADETTAVTESYLFAWLRYAHNTEVERAQISRNTKNSMMMSARYVDLFTLEGGCWKIRRRTTVFEETMYFDAPDGEESLKPQYTTDRHGYLDTLTRLKKEVGL